MRDAGVGAMRRTACGFVLAGTALALIMAAPTPLRAAPEQSRPAALPTPAAGNDQPQQNQQAAPAPEAPAAAAALQNADGDKPDLRGSLDKLSSTPDTPIADRLREIATGTALERRVERAPDRQAIEAFYAARNFAPLWISDGKPNARAQAVIAQLKNAAADGLDPADYPVPALSAATGADALADNEIELTYSLLTYARHLAVGRIAPGRVLAEVDYGTHAPEPADILRKIADAADTGTALESFNPPHQGFRALKAKLAELRAGSAPTGTSILNGPVIRPGDQDPRIPDLRERLHVSGDPGDITYDRALADAVRKVQREAGLRPTGLINARTIEALNGPEPDEQIARVIANMERWRWLPRELGQLYVMVNIPDYSLKVVRDDQTVWRTNIIVGKPQTPTPLLTAAMQEVIVNPSWHVPQSIIRNELLPRYARDPNVFARMGLVVTHERGGRLNVTQPPGARNALGRIKFDFPNQFQVYLHDTPEKRLFASDKRAFSHGCMRVEDPTKLGEVILAAAMPASAPSEQQITRMFGRSERVFKLTERPMVHVTYQTAFVDDAGRLAFDDDVYGVDARMAALLQGGERRIAGAHRPGSPPRQAVAAGRQNLLQRAERAEARRSFRSLDRLVASPHPQPARLAAWPAAASAPEYRSQASQMPLVGPLLAIFGR
jgi:murein L,D-transpeptidase YcbB/YkuD